MPITQLSTIDFWVNAHTFAGMIKKSTPGERLRAFRVEHEWTVADLAEELEIHRNHVCALQSGRRNPGRALAARIEKLTDIKASEW